MGWDGIPCLPLFILRISQYSIDWQTFSCSGKALCTLSLETITLLTLYSGFKDLSFDCISIFAPHVGKHFSISILTCNSLLLLRILFIPVGTSSKSWNQIFYLPFFVIYNSSTTVKTSSFSLQSLNAFFSQLPLTSKWTWFQSQYVQS